MLAGEAVLASRSLTDCKNRLGGGEFACGGADGVGSRDRDKLSLRLTRAA